MKVVYLLLVFFLNAVCTIASTSDKHDININPVIELTDQKWDQIQKGQWLVGFFDNDKESKELADYWQLFAHKCNELDINVGRIFAPENPGLYVRFLVTVFPKVFFVKNGVAHEIPKANKEDITQIIKEQKWNKLKPVNFLSNPFSVQMSLLSHLFVHAVNLYNYENSIVQKYISAPSATDIVFALTFIIVGTFLGLLMTCAFGLIQIFFMDSKESELDDDGKHSDDDDDKEEEKESNESNSVRKRK